MKTNDLTKKVIRTDIWNLWRQCMGQEQLSKKQKYWTMLGNPYDCDEKLRSAEIDQLLDQKMAEANQVISCQTTYDSLIVIGAKKKAIGEGSHRLTGEQILERQIRLAKQAEYKGLTCLKGDMATKLYGQSGNPDFWPSFVHYTGRNLTDPCLNQTTLNDTQIILNALIEHYQETGQTCFLAANYWLVLRRGADKTDPTDPETNQRANNLLTKGANLILKDMTLGNANNKELHQISTTYNYQDETNRSLMGYLFFQIGFPPKN